MAKWTQVELDTLKAAVASGVLTVSYDGPPRRSVTYHSLKEMRDLLAEMERDVNSSSARPYRLASMKRGV